MACVQEREASVFNWATCGGRSWQEDQSLTLGTHWPKLETLHKLLVTSHSQRTNLEHRGMHCDVLKFFSDLRVKTRLWLCTKRKKGEKRFGEERFLTINSSQLQGLCLHWRQGALEKFISATKHIHPLWRRPRIYPHSWDAVPCDPLIARGQRSTPLSSIEQCLYDNATKRDTEYWITTPAPWK